MLRSRIILLYIRHHTWREFAGKVIAAVLRPVYERRDVLIMHRTAAPLPTDAAAGLIELTPDDIDRMLEVMYATRQGLQDRFARGERCFGAVESGRIVSFFWSQVGLKDFYELHLRFRLGCNQAWLYNAITVRAARGRGLYPAITRHIIATLGRAGITDYYVDLRPRNLASARGLAKAGFTRFVLIRMRKLFSCVRYEAKVFDQDRWERFSALIEGFDRRQWTVSQPT